MRHRGGVRAVNTVFEKHHAGDFRLVARRKKYEPAVVAQIFGRPTGGDASGVGNHLR